MLLTGPLCVVDWNSRVVNWNNCVVNKTHCVVDGQHLTTTMRTATHFVVNRTALLC